MALKYPDRLESNNPAAYGIVKATEISGHRTVQSVDDLYSLADAILSDSGNNTNNDAIGQKWYVISETKEYKLIDWNNRKSSAGWEQVNLKTINGESILGSGDIELADKAKVDELDHYRNWYRYGAARAASLYSLTTSSSSEDIKAALTDIQGNDPKQAGLDECIQKHLQLAEYVMGGTVMVGWSGHDYILTYVGQLNPKSEVYACTITINAVDSDGSTTYSVVRDGVKIKVDSNYLPLTGGTMTGDIVFSTTGGIIINDKTDQDLLNAAGGTTPISDILSSTEGSLSDLEARVKANEDKLATVQGEETVDGSIKKALKDAKDYTNQKLAWITLD